MIRGITEEQFDYVYSGTIVKLEEYFNSLPPALTYEEIEKVLAELIVNAPIPNYEWDDKHAGYCDAIIDVKEALKTMMEVK